MSRVQAFRHAVEQTLERDAASMAWVSTRSSAQAAINRISPNYERHGVGLTLESYQTYSTYYDSGVGTGAATDTAIGRRGVTRTHYSLVVRDGEPVATGQVLGVAPPVNAVVGASAPPAPSGFCTQCGAPMKSDARFCGSCGAAR